MVISFLFKNKKTFEFNINLTFSSFLNCVFYFHETRTHLPEKVSFKENLYLQMQENV